MIDVNMTKTNKYEFIKACQESNSRSALNFKFTILPGIYNPDGANAGEFDGTKGNQGQFLNFMYEFNSVS